MIPRILHISTAKDWRGGEQQLAYLTEELNDGRADQHVVCYPDSPVAQHCERIGVKIYPLTKRSGVDLRLARGIRSAAEDCGAQLVHTHDAHAHTASVIANAAFGMGVPLVVSRRVDFHVHSIFSKKFKYGHPSVRKIVCVSHAIERIMTEDLGESARICTIHSGVDLNRFENPDRELLRRELGLEPHIKLIGNVAAHAPHKDLFTFLRTVKELNSRRNDLHFVSIGGGPLTQELVDFARDQGLTENVTFLGFRKDVTRLLPGIDVFLMTSRTEGLGTTILDAFAAQVPVVSTNAGGIPEMVEDGFTGLLAPVGDHMVLANKVEQMLSSPRGEFVAAASVKLRSFTKQHTAMKTLELYLDLLRSG